MPENGWRNDPLQIVTVALYDMGFTRYLLQVRVGNEEREAVVWARGADEIRVRAARQRNYRNIRVSELPRGRFYAEATKGNSFKGAKTGEYYTMLSVTGDTILWPEYHEQAEEQTA